MTDEWMFRPRDEYDADLVPGTLRAQYLDLSERIEVACIDLDAAIAKMPRRYRWPLRLWLLYRIHRTRLSA